MNGTTIRCVRCRLFTFVSGKTPPPATPFVCGECSMTKRVDERVVSR